jgi:hypothetical protein
MRKLYLMIPAFLLALNVDVNAQNSNNSNQIPTTPLGKFEIQEAEENQIRRNLTRPNREETILWSNDFSDEDDWITGVNEGGDTNWEFLHCLPTEFCSLTYPFSPTHLQPILSPTAANGYAYINSDEAGQGPILDTWIQYDGTIDIEGNESVFIRFNEFLTSFREQTWVEFSTDGGETWEGVRTDGFNSGGSVVGARDAVKEVNVSAIIGGADEVMLRFRYVADWDWYWFIDDVEIYVSEEPKLELTGAHINTYYSGNEVDRFDEQEYTLMVINDENNMTTPIIPIAEISNTGGAALTNVILTVSVNGPDDFSEVLTTDPIDLAIGEEEVLTAPEFEFQDSNPKGIYTFSFTLSADQEFSEENIALLSRTRTVELSEFQYGKGSFTPTGSFTGTTSFLAANDNPLGNYSIGASYYAFDNATAYQLGVQLSPLSDVGTTFSLVLFQLVGGDENYLDEISVTTTEDMLDQMVYFDFEEPILIEQDEVYLVYLSYFEEGSGDKVYVRTAGSSPGQLNYIRGEQVGGNCCFISSVPMLRMGLSPDDFTSVPEVDKGEIAKMRSFPNPFDNVTQVQFILADNANVQFELYDVTGKLIQARNLGNVAGQITHNIELDGSNLNSGVYIYTLIIDGERVTQKIVKR